MIVGDPARDRSRGAHPGLRPGRRLAGRPLPHRRGRGHHPGRHGPDPPGDRASSPGRQPAAGGSGDPSAATAYGVLLAMRAVARHLWGGTSLRGRHVTVAGVGKVGTCVVRHLVEEGARVTVADVDRAAVARVTSGLAVDVADPADIHRVDCDIYSPCAMGGALDPTTIAELRCAAVVGCANNQLADPSVRRPARTGPACSTPPTTWSTPAGIINLAEELVPGGYQPGRARAALGRIFDTTAALLARAEADGITHGPGGRPHGRGTTSQRPEPRRHGRTSASGVRSGMAHVISDHGASGRDSRRPSHRAGAEAGRTWSPCTAPWCWPGSSTRRCGT